MSANFDPSKLDLDPNNIEDTSTKKTDTVSPTKDILGDIQLPEKTEDIVEKKITKTPSPDVLWDISTPTTDPEAKETIKKDEKTQNSPDTEVKETPKDDTPVKEAIVQDEEVEDKKLIDINIASLEAIIMLVEDKKYDFVIIEPEDMQVKVTFKQDNIDRDIKYIKYPNYTNILFKTKQVTKLVVEDTGSPQEGKWSIKIGSKVFKVSSKTAPGQNGERIFISAKQDTSELAKKTAQKTSLSMIFGFLATILFIGLILWGAFIGFIVFNAKTVEDVKFFAGLGINLNDINTFISGVVTLIFSILLFICTAALSLSLFKFFLTKKTYKRKKVLYWILSTLLLFTTFATWSAWMFIDRQIKSLPNWQEQAYGDLRIFNNDLLISKDFDTEQSLLSSTENLIGPITLQFDLETFQNNQARVWVTIKKYVWDFWGEIEETFGPKITRLFDEKWNYELSVTAIGEDTGWEEIEKIIGNIPSISVSHLIKVEETLTNNGGKKLSFDANDLSNLWKIVWYFKEPITETNTDPRYPDWQEIEEGYEFIPGKIFFEELFVGISIRSGDETDQSISKVIVISPDGNSDISGDIVLTPDIENELLYTLWVENASTSFSNGFIEKYEWRIEEKTYSILGDISENNSSPSIEHEFKNFGEQEIEVTLTDSKGKTEILKKTFSIQKKVSLRSSLILRDSNENEIEDVRYEENTYEYFIDSFGIPGSIALDARLVRPVNVLYSLTDVRWDIWDDGNIDGTGKSYTHFIPNEWNHTIVAEYEFTHRKIPEDKIILKEYVYVEGIKKEAILDLQIELESNYAPVTVRFDASKSLIKNDNIVKFIYDYGDGVVEERDAINPGHKYSAAWDYIIELTVVWESGKRYSLSKQLILLPPPQEVNVSLSLKKAPIRQWIDFSSSKSSWQIIEYFWDFGDGNISTEANPSHSYDKAWTYTVTLKADFANNNAISDSVEIEIFEEE